MRASLSRLRAETDCAVMSSERCWRSRTAPSRESAAIAASRLRVGIRSSKSPPLPRADRRRRHEPALAPGDVLDPGAHRVDVARAASASVSEAERSTLRRSRPSERGEPSPAGGGTGLASVVERLRRRCRRAVVGRRRALCARLGARRGRAARRAPLVLPLDAPPLSSLAGRQRAHERDEHAPRSRRARARAPASRATSGATRSSGGRRATPRRGSRGARGGRAPA